MDPAYTVLFFFFFSSRRRHTRFDCDWSSDVCSSDLGRIVRQHRHEGCGVDSASWRVAIQDADAAWEIDSRIRGGARTAHCLPQVEGGCRVRRVGTPPMAEITIGQTIAHEGRPPPPLSICRRCDVCQSRSQKPSRNPRSERPAPCCFTCRSPSPRSPLPCTTSPRSRSSLAYTRWCP